MVGGGLDEVRRLRQFAYGDRINGNINLLSRICRAHKTDNIQLQKGVGGWFAIHRSRVCYAIKLISRLTLEQRVKLEYFLF